MKGHCYNIRRSSLWLG